MQNYGYVEARMIVLLLIGAAGSGKTHAKELFLGRPPPDMRQSTALAEEAIRVMSTVRATISGTDEVTWEQVNLQQLKQLIASTLAHETCEKDTLTHDCPPEPQLSCSHDDAFSASSPLEISSEVSVSPTPDLDPKCSIYEEFLELMVSSQGSRKLFEVDWVYLIDSGGQPSFYEILPLFICNTTVVAFVLKLSECLSDRPMLEYYGQDGQPCGGSHSSPLTNEQHLRHCLRLMQSRKSPSQSTLGPKIFAVGTHRDREHLCPENRTDKNTKLLEMLRMCFPNNKLGFYCTTKPEELIYPINAKVPSEEDKKVAEQFRREVSKAGGQIKVQIPLPWYVLEQYLRQLSLEKARKILSTGECEGEARKLRMKWEACEAALEFLDKLNLFFYRPEYLKGVVFCGSQLCLDKITELIELMYRLLGHSESKVISSWLHRLVGVPLQPDQPSGSSFSVSDCCDGLWLRFRDYAIVTEEILKKFPRHYVYDEDLFTPAKLLELLTGFQVIAPLSDGADEYVMPCLLREVAPDELKNHRQCDPLSPAGPLLIHFQDHWVPAGVFTILISYLQNASHWKLRLSRSRNPTCFYRNCVEFKLPTGRGGSVILIDSFEYLEVHVVDAKPKTCQKACPRIRQDVINTIKQAGERLHYDALEPKVAFFCSSATGKCSSEPHFAEVVDNDEWVCSLNGRVNGELTSRQVVWLSQEALECSVRVFNLSNDLHVLMTVLGNAAHIADQLGIQLGLDPDLVKSLKQQAMGDCLTHLREVLTSWLQRTSPPATLNALINALSNPPINKEVLAWEVQRKFE